MYITDYANPIQISTVTAGAAGTSAITPAEGTA